MSTTQSVGLTSEKHHKNHARFPTASYVLLTTGNHLITSVKTDLKSERIDYSGSKRIDSMDPHSRNKAIALSNIGPGVNY